MIIDKLDNSSLYERLNPLFPKAFEYLKSLDLSKLEIGKTEILGTDLFIMISDSTLKSKAKLEVHNKYIDIQIPISKAEGFGWKSRYDLRSESTSFNNEKDIQFFEDESAMYFEVPAKNFVIFFPEDAHAPCRGEGSVLKIVIKVLVK